MALRTDELLKHKPQEEGADEWLLSYSDMVTLLFAFFVILLSMSSLDLVKFELISKYFTKETKRMTLSDLQKTIQEFLKKEDLQQDVNVNLTSKGVEISFKDKLLFDIGKADIKPVAYPVLGKMGQLLNRPEISDRKISVEGHTDSLPIKTPEFPSNWELSSGRAATVVRFFIEQNLKKERFEALGYADTHPVVPETSLVKGVPENRRVIIVISPESYLVDLKKREEITVGGESKPIIKKTEVPTSKISTTVVVSTKSITTETLSSSAKQKMQLHYSNAIEYLKKNQKKLALKEFQEVLKIDPTHQPSRIRIAKLKEELKK